MAGHRYTEADLRREVRSYRDHLQLLADDEAFVVWFLRAFITEDEQAARAALTGGSGDKGLDAVFVDDEAKRVFVVQGKYRKGIAEKSEKRTDVLQCASLARCFAGAGKEFDVWAHDLAPAAQKLAEIARERVAKRKFQLHLLYVTTGRCADGLRKEAARTAANAGRDIGFDLFDGSQILHLLGDYLDGVAPPVPTLDIAIEGGEEGILRRRDPSNDIESWVFSASGDTVRGLFGVASFRLFARNVRGFLGRTDINQGMQGTLEKEPEFFWYYNNGVTIICDDAERIQRGGQDVLRVHNPQVINGQQTTRTLAAVGRTGRHASVLVRVIRVSRDVDEGPERFEQLVTKIVAATNWQNAIRTSDLMANDRQQIAIERALRPVGYWYVRKRQTRREALRAAGPKRYQVVTKEHLAQAVAACELDPAVVREGKEALFDERLYSSVFPTAEPFFYLTRNMLSQTAGYAARGKPERGYAKWLVLHFAWSHVAPLLNAKPRKEAFIGAWRRGGPIFDATYSAVDALFRAARGYYRVRRGRGEAAQDPASFYRIRNRHREFARYWASGRNTQRGALKRALKRLDKALRKQVES